MSHYHNFKGRRYTPDRKVEIVERREGLAGRYWRVVVDGVTYHVANERGKMVRIPYQPRGRNRGFHWYGIVRDEKGEELYRGRVFKSTGPLSLLHDVGVISWQWEVDALRQKDYILEAEVNEELRAELNRQEGGA
jgi:hypothetical protein